MSIIRKVKRVEAVFQQLEKEISALKAATKLNCVSGCGLCCKKPDIEATILEFLPFAYHLFQEGKAVEWLEKVEQQADSLCAIFTPFYSESRGGLCNHYLHRGLICRLFGFSASLNKYGQPVLSTCAIIKTELKPQYEQAAQSIEQGLAIPVMRNFYMRMYAIDQALSEKFYPINTAIRLAIEKVLAYYAYRPRRAS